MTGPSPRNVGGAGEPPAVQLQLVVPSERSMLRAMRRELDGWLALNEIGGAEQRDITLAVWEAVANAVEHPVDPIAPHITLTVTRLGDRVLVEIVDTGTWRLTAVSGNRGLGLRLVKSLMSNVEIVRTSSGTTIVMDRAIERPLPESV